MKPNHFDWLNFYFSGKYDETEKALFYKTLISNSKTQGMVKEGQETTRAQAKGRHTLLTVLPFILTTITSASGVPSLTEYNLTTSTIVSWFYFVCDELDKDLFFKPQAFEWKKWHLEEELWVCFELQRYTSWDRLFLQLSVILDSCLTNSKVIFSASVTKPALSRIWRYYFYR